jgi:tetratricopeptide (TPR) repeat protein
VPRQQQIAAIVQAVLVTALVVLGCIGIGSSLAPVKPVAQQGRERPDRETDERALYVHQRVLEQRLALRRAYGDPDRHVQFARACAGRALVQVCAEYTQMFPGALADDQFPPSHYEQWRRGWYARDPHGDLRRALHHARRALRLNPSPPTRLRALELIASVQYQRSRFEEAIPPLREVLKVTPHNQSIRIRLAQAYAALARASGAPSGQTSFAPRL